MKGSWGEDAEREMSERRRRVRPEDLRIGTGFRVIIIRANVHHSQGSSDGNSASS